MSKDNVTLKALVQIAKPYDESSHCKETFLKNITPELEKQFAAQYSEEFEKQIEEKGVYFIVNHLKGRFGDDKPTIKLIMCGREKLPTISLNCKREKSL